METQIRSTMTAKFKIAKITGPSGVFAAYTILIFGLATIYFSWTSIPIALVGAAMAFSYNMSVIDYGRKRYKPVFRLFGFISFGSWVDMEPADIAMLDDFRVILLRDSDQKKITLARFNSEKEATELISKIQKMLRGD